MDVCGGGKDAAGRTHLLAGEGGGAFRVAGEGQGTLWLAGEGGIVMAGEVMKEAIM